MIRLIWPAVMTALMDMVKLDSARLETAHRGQ